MDTIEFRLRDLNRIGASCGMVAADGDNATPAVKQADLSVC